MLNSISSFSHQVIPIVRQQIKTSLIEQHHKVKIIAALAIGFFVVALFAVCRSFSSKVKIEESTQVTESISRKPSKKIDISSMTEEEINSLARQKEYVSLAPIDWEKLSFNQFKAACGLEKYILSIPFASFDKEKTTYWLKLDKLKINKLTNRDIENNIMKIEPYFLSQLLYRDPAINVSNFSLDHIKEILKSDTLAYDLTTINPALCNAELFSDFLKECPTAIKRLPPKLIAAHIKQIDPRFYKNLNSTQVEEVDFSQLNGKEFLPIFKNSTISVHQYKQLDLNLFTAKDIKEMVEHKNIICFLSAKTVADNFDKFELNMLSSFLSDQINALNFAKMTGEQINQFSSTLLIEDKQWFAINLSNFTSESVEKLLSKNILEKLSPETISANFSLIPTKYYNKLTMEQLKKVDFSTLTKEQIIALENNLNYSLLKLFWSAKSL